MAKSKVNWRKASLIAVISIIAILVVGIYTVGFAASSNNFVSKYIVKITEERRIAYDDFLSVNDIKVVLVGTAGPMSPEVAQNCTAVFVGGQFLLFDAGDYAQKRMEQFNLPIESLDAVFLTHFHNDHVADLGEVMQRSYLYGRENQLIVYGPTGTENIVTGFNMIYSADSDYRTEHHGEEVMPSEYHFASAVEFDAESDEVVVYEKDGVKVTAFKVSHPPIEPVFGYMIEYEDKKVVISGDTLVTEKLAQYSESADLLVMDIMNYELVKLMEDTYADIGDEELAKIMFDIREYHPDVIDFANMAQKQNVKRLTLTHYAPAAPNNVLMRHFYVKPIKKIYSGELIAGNDGTTIVIPMN